jgi:hypothetical protein
MTTLPIHTVQHIKSVYNKYQVIAVVFTATTLLAALLAAVSGFQLAKLRKMQPVETQSPTAPVEEAAPGDAGLEKQVKMLENQLQSEKTTSQELRAKVHELEKKIAAVKVAAAPQTQPAPGDAGLEKQVKMLENRLQSEKTTSQELRAKVHELEKKIAAVKVAAPPQTRPAPAKPKAPEVAPATVTPPPVQTAGEGKTVAAPPETTSPSVPAAATEPPPTPIQTEKKESQVQMDTPAPDTGPSMSGKPVDESKPSGDQPPPQPAVPSMEKNQTAPESVTTPAPSSSPAVTSVPAASTDAAQQAAPDKAGDETGTPSSAQPTADPNVESQTDAKP